MSKYVKSNMFIIGVMLFLGLVSILFNDTTYIQKRIFGIAINIIEVVIVLVLANKQHMSLKDMGLSKPVKPIAWIVGIAVALIPMCLMIVLNSNNLSTMFPQKVSLSLCIIQSIYYFIIVAPIEEIIFRGFILENFNKNFSKNSSILFTSFLFALIHIYNGSMMNVIMTFVISILYCKVKLITYNRSIYPCMIGHAINDSLNQWIPYFLF